MINLFEQLKQMHEDGLHGNVKALASMMLSLPEYTLPLKEEYTAYAKKFQILVFYGDALYHCDCYRRAEAQYLEAVQLRKQLIKMKPKSSTKITVTPEVEVKFRLYQCYTKLGDARQALSMLEGIAPKQRTTKINMTLGKLYQKHGMERSAITCYKEILRSSPAALQAAKALLKLGVTLQEVTTLMSSSGGVNSSLPDWLSQYLKGCSFGFANKHSKAIQTFQNLEAQTLKDNICMLCTLGCSYYLSGDVQNAICCYEKLRLLDKHCLEGMDIYSQILAEEKEKDKLEKLAQELIESNENCTQSWVAMSHYCACINQTSKAVYFAQKAHMMDISNVPALVLKASLLLILDKQQEAIIHYREAIRLSPNQLKPYQGLVDCHLKAEKYKEAINVARNAHKTIGANARTLTLCAKVYACENHSQEKAKTMLKKALTHDPSYLPTVYLLCDILMKCEEYEEASELLSKQLETQQTVRLYSLNGDCLKELGRVQEGLQMYSKALKLDPDNVKAMDGMQSLERDTTGELDMSSIGLHEPRNRSSMEDLDGLGSDIQWME